jgi:ADP-heptose:LPS heptosyltransferase
MASARARSLGDSRSVRRIALVSRLTLHFDLGDMVMSNAVVRCVRQRFPDSHIILIARADEIDRYTSRFYAKHSWIDEFHACPALTDRSWGRWLRFYRQMRALHVDLCIANVESLPAWFMFLAGVPWRMGMAPANRWLARFLTHPIVLPVADRRQAHWTDIAAAYATALNGDQVGQGDQADQVGQGGQRPEEGKGARHLSVRDLVPYVRYEDDEAIDLASGGLRRPIVAMHIGGGRHWNRRWPRDSYLSLCVRLTRERGASIALLGGDDEKAEVMWLIERLKEECPDARITDFAGASLNRLLNVYAQADLYIGNDSGLLHLAVAMGLPVIALYGPSDHRFLGPDKVDPRHQVVTTDSPCSRRGCRLGCTKSYDIDAPDYPACMKTLDVTCVWAAVTRSLCLQS